MQKYFLSIAATLQSNCAKGLHCSALIHLCMYCIHTADIINPRRACAERVTVVVSCVCMSVRTRYSGSTRSYKYNEICHHVKRQICGNNKMAFFLKWPYSKVRAGFTYLGRGGHL